MTERLMALKRGHRYSHYLAAQKKSPVVDNNDIGTIGFAVPPYF
ncbi:hypothetical protein Nizo2264_0289 [Lactiplantibacillus plantarum]|nr:hypothetical protein Nizo2264_0289 [Lactiplantibacillus plantarum]